MLVLKEVTHRYGEIVAVRALTLAVHRGEMFGLIGPDGAGKTTTLRLALGLLRPASGRIETCGLDPVRARRALTGKVGYLSQRFSLYGDLSVDENIAFFAEIHGVAEWKARRDELLEMVRMTAFRDRLAERLSGGMKQKLALACTLIHTPELLILDEPTTGVDPVSRRDFWKLLARLQRQGLTIVMSTPYLDEAERCQRVALIDHGMLLGVDSPAALRGRWRGGLLEVIARPKRKASESLRAIEGVADVETFGERLHVTLAPGARVDADRVSASLRSAGVEIESLREVDPSLEDIFIARIHEVETEVAATSRAAGKV